MAEKSNKMTLGELAKQLGVSRATVSRALNGAPGVGAEMRDRIIACAREQGLEADPSERILHPDSLRIIGLVFGDIRNPFYAELAYHIQKTLEEAGFTLMLFNSDYNVERERGFLELVKDFHLAGLILFNVQMEMEEENFRSLGIPVVFANRSLPMQNFDFVLLDNFKAGYIATMHLIELGHQRIGYIQGPELSSVTHQRLSGYHQAQRNYYLKCREEDMMRGNLKLSDGYALAGELFSRDDRPSAMLINNDLMAIGFLDWCQEHGVGVPEDISLVSIDDIFLAAIHGIGLTTVSQRTEQMGVAAAELLLRRIREPEAPYQRIILEPELKVRKTTAPFYTQR